MVDGAGRRYFSCMGLDDLPRSHVGSTAVAPLNIWDRRELGLRPECRVLGGFNFQDVHLADGPGGHMAHAMG
jgi:hypothetical protein